MFEACVQNEINLCFACSFRCSTDTTSQNICTCRRCRIVDKNRLAIKKGKLFLKIILFSLFGFYSPHIPSRSRERISVLGEFVLNSPCSYIARLFSEAFRHGVIKLSVGSRRTDVHAEQTETSLPTRRRGRRENFRDRRYSLDFALLVCLQRVTSRLPRWL